MQRMHALTSSAMVTLKPYRLQFRRLALKFPPLGPKWDRWTKKLGCASDPPVCSLLVWEDRMHTQVFSPTYPTWALVGGTSRPAGETVHIIEKGWNRSNSSTQLKIIIQTLQLGIIKDKRTNTMMVIILFCLVLIPFNDITMNKPSKLLLRIYFIMSHCKSQNLYICCKVTILLRIKAWA